MYEEISFRLFSRCLLINVICEDKQEGPDMVVHACNSNYLRGRSRSLKSTIIPRSPDFFYQTIVLANNM
jgi:hypothetical protein